MRRSLLNKQFLPKPLRQALVLITLLLLPSAAWGEELVTTNAPSGSSWSIDGFSNYAWTISSSSAFTEGSGGKIDINFAGNPLTLYLAKPSDGKNRIIKGITLEGYEVSNDITVTAKFSGDWQTRTFTNNYYELDSPVEWGEESITLTFTASDNSKTSSINSIKVTTEIVTSYNLNIAGTEVTSVNADNITNTQTITSGTVTFNASTNTLTLNGAKIVGSITYTGNSDLTVEINGENTVGNQSTFGELSDMNTDNENRASLIIKGSDNSSLSFDAPTSSSGSSISGFADVTLDGVYLQSESYCHYVINQFNGRQNGYKDINGNYVHKLTFTTVPQYPLWISGKQVNENNASNVLSDATSSVKYNATNKILTLTNATIGTSGASSSIVSSLESAQLTIELVGTTNKLYGNITDDSSAGTLKFTGDGSLEIINNDGTISGYTAVDFGGFNLKSNSPGINYGEASGVQDFHRLQDYTKDNAVSNVTITTETTFYPIWVHNGTDYTQITDVNKANVLGDDYKSISYDGSGKLTLKGAVVSTGDKQLVVGGGLDALTVYLVGYSTFKNFYFTGTTALTLATNETYPGALADITATWSDNTSRITYANGLKNPAGENPKVTANIPNLGVGYITGTDQNVAGENSPYTIYGTGSDFSASSAEKMGHYIKISGTSEATLWPSSLSNANLLSNVLFQFDWGTCGNTNVTVQVKGLTEDGALDGKTYSDLIALSTANADGVVDIELNGAVTSKNLQLVFTSESEFSIVPLSVGFKETTYDLVVYGTSTSNGTTVTLANKDNVLGDDFATVKFTPATDDTDAKLTLNNGASVSKITSGLAALTIEIKGTSSVGYIDTNTATEGDKTLTITKGSDNSSLALTAAQDHSVIEGFKSVSVGEGLYVQSANPCVYSTSNKRYETTDATPALLGTLTFTTTPYYPLWVTRMQSSDSNTYQVSYDNKNYILGTSITSVQFDGTTNTLTFVENEDLYMYSCVYVTSGLDALKIAINGSCKLSSFNKNDNTPAITSVNPDAPLTIALVEGATSGDLALISAKGKAISGFKSLTHTGLLNLTDGASYSTENLQWSASKAAFATEIKKPTIEINYSNKYFSIKNPNAEGDGGTLMLKTVRMTSEGKVEDDEEEIKGSYSQNYNYGIAIWKYWVKANDTESDPIYVCRLGLEDVEVTYGDTEIPTPNILPENIDGVSLSYSTEDYEADVAEVVEGTITIKSTGRQPIDATFSNIPDDYTFLTDEENGTPKASFCLLVKPQKPTLSLEAGTYVGTQTVEVGNISPNATAKYYTYEGENAPENPEVSVVPENHKIEIASSKTLVVYSETEYDLGDNSGTGYLTSETVSATYTILKDISLCTVTPEEATYTGEAIEPVVEAPNGATPTTLTAGTDYTVSYQKVTGETATDVESMIDAGTYKITITGKGSYGGTKEISDFQIAQASLADAAISKLIVGDKEYEYDPDKDIEIPYTGEAIQPEVVVVFNDGTVTVDASEYTVSYGNNTEVSNETAIASVTVTSIGKNFTAGTSTSLNFKIVPATVTITADDQTVTYNAKAQEYDISEAVSNDKAKLTVTYYATEADLNNGENALSGAPTDADTYYVRVALDEESQLHFVADPASATFTIEQLDISQADITLDNNELTYNGEQQTVNVTKVMAGDIEVPVDCYEVSGNTGKEAGDYKLTVTAKTMDSSGNPIKNNFTGSAEKDWKIKNRTVTTDELGLSENQSQATYYSETEDLEVPEGVVAYIITGVNGNNVVTQRIRYIKKGVAVFVEQTTSTENPLEVIPDASELPLKGTAVDLNVASISGGTVYVLYKGEFVKSTTGTIPAKRCYLLLPNNVAAGTRAFGIIGGGSDGSTAIKSINDEPSTIDNWYDMGGHRIEKPTKTGIYIKNGKKVAIK